MTGDMLDLVGFRFNTRKYIVIYNMPCIVILAGWDPSCQKGLQAKKAYRRENGC